MDSLSAVSAATQLGFPSPVNIMDVFRAWEPDAATFIGESLLPSKGIGLDVIDYDVYGQIRGQLRPRVIGGNIATTSYLRQYNVLMHPAHWALSLRFDETDFTRIRKAGTLNQLAGEEFIMNATRMMYLMTQITKESARWEVLTTGHLAVDDNGVARDIDYLFPAGNFITPDILWDAIATAKPIEDIQAATELFFGRSNKRPVMYINAYDIKFLSQNTVIRDLIRQNPVVLQLGRDMIAQVFPQLTGDLEKIVIYRDGYLDTNYGYIPFIPKGKAVLIAPPVMNQVLGNFIMTPSVHNGGIANPQPGDWVLPEDKTATKECYYDITAGTDGAPTVYFPENVVVINTYTP